MVASQPGDWRIEARVCVSWMYYLPKTAYIAWRRLYTIKEETKVVALAVTRMPISL